VFFLVRRHSLRAGRRSGNGTRQTSRAGQGT
jgi:hypothetical protein